MTDNKSKSYIYITCIKICRNDIIDHKNIKYLAFTDLKTANDYIKAASKEKQIFLGEDYDMMKTYENDFLYIKLMHRSGFSYISYDIHREEFPSGLVEINNSLVLYILTINSYILTADKKLTQDNCVTIDTATFDIFLDETSAEKHLFRSFMEESHDNKESIISLMYCKKNLEASMIYIGGRNRIKREVELKFNVLPLTLLKYHQN